MLPDSAGEGAGGVGVRGESATIYLGLLAAGLAAGRASARKANSLGALCRWNRAEAAQILCAGIFVLLYARYGLSGPFFWLAVLSAMLPGLAVMDARTYRIPNDILLWIGFTGMLRSAAGHIGWRAAGLGCLSGIALFCALLLVTRGGIGWGDVKMAGALGIWFGVGGILQIFVAAFTVAAGVSAILLLTKRKTKKDPIALGPYLCMGTLLLVLAG